MSSGGDAWIVGDKRAIDGAASSSVDLPSRALTRSSSAASHARRESSGVRGESTPSIAADSVESRLTRFAR